MFSLDSLFNYYGIDWIGALMLFVSTFLIGNKKREGFLVGIGGCLLMLVFSIMAGSVGSFVLNVVLGILNLRGYFRWTRLKKRNC